MRACSCVYMCMLVTQSSPTLCNPMDCSSPLSVKFSRQEYWSCCQSLLHGIFPNQGSSLCLPHCRQILYSLSHLGRPCVYIHTYMYLHMNMVHLGCIYIDTGREWQPLQYSCLENPMDRGAWQATVHGVAKEQLRHDLVTKQ